MIWKTLDGDLQDAAPVFCEKIPEGKRSRCPQRSGYGAEIAAQIVDKLFDELDAPILRVCGANIPVPNATLPEIESAPTVAKITAAAKKLCQGGKFNG